MANLIYGNFKKIQLEGATATRINLAADTIKVALVTSTYVPNTDTHDMFDDVTNEVTGTGYTAGGATLTSPAVAYDSTNDRAEFDAADVTWATSTITARGAVVYKSTGTASTSPLIAYIDFTTDKISTAGNFTITWDAEGVIQLG